MMIDIIAVAHWGSTLEPLKARPPGMDYETYRAARRANNKYRKDYLSGKIGHKGYIAKKVIFTYNPETMKTTVRTIYNGPYIKREQEKSK